MSSPRPPSIRQPSRDSAESESGHPHHHARGIAIRDQPRRPSVSMMSSSAPHREPIRSFLHESVRDVPAAVVDGAQHARSVRQDTAELASYVLDRRGSFRGRWADSHRRRSSHGQQQQQQQQQDAGGLDCDVDVGGLYDCEDDDGNAASDGDDSAVTDGWSVHHDAPSVIFETSEPPSPPEVDLVEGPVVEDDESGPSLLASMLRREPSGESVGGRGEAAAAAPLAHRETTEATPLLAAGGQSSGYGSEQQQQQQQHGHFQNGHSGDVESQHKDDQDASKARRRRRGRLGNAAARLRRAGAAATSKDVWNGPTLWENAVLAPARCLPAVAVGLLLNILDGLSYGMILFPLGNPIFSKLGPAGMSIFYVSTIISQLTFSSGSIFKGAIGSELIEVVPFFHNMAGTIADSVRDDGADAIIATTIVSYALSAMLTGLVFYLMGRFHFGYVVGFIPRHILTGCIGGVGWFLVATGFEVSARLEGSLGYDLDTARELLRPETVPLWLLPLVLAVVLFWGQTRGASKYFLPLYILCVPVVFYAAAAAMGKAQPEGLRDGGWVFESPPAGEPWWHFYTLYKFHLVRWDAVAETIPAMLALTFFGILHVPINVPALARQCGEDNADLDVELKLHGLSNLASGLAGSIQNYLVYANTTFFMRSGGDTRLAGFMLAALTTAVMVLGPVLVGFIPVMMVGTLIFDLGFELLLEALWEPRRRMRPVEYATVVAIVLVMGVYDFVVGIGVGILLAFVSLIVQSSRVSPVRGSYTGAEVTSTVRRSPSQHAYLHRAGRQIYIVKLTGYLFFGTIVSVEAKMRALLEGQQQQQRQPAAAATTTTAGHGGRAGGGGRIRYVVIDLWHVSGLDYSAGEGFNTVSRLLRRRGITLLLSGVADGGEIAKSLRLVGLGCGGGGGAANEDGPTASGDGEVMLLPDLNSALESCENELLKTLYASEAAAALARRGNGRRPSTGQQHHQQQQQQQSFQDIAVANRNPLALIDAAMPRSPRQSDLHEAAALTLLQHAPPCTPPLVPSHRYSPETPAHRPVPPSPALTLLLRILRAVGGPSSAVDESFWAPAAALFHRLALPPGALLFRRGEPARGFYLVERGVLRAEYNLPQGRLSEMIVAGTTCGELPFFSGTLRTARVVVDGGGAAREGGPAWEDEGAASHLVESAGGETALLEEGGEEEGEAGCVLWVLGADGWARLRTQRPDVAQELLTLALKLTSERMASITSYVLAVAG